MKVTFSLFFCQSLFISALRVGNGVGKVVTVEFLYGET